MRRRLILSVLTAAGLVAAAGPAAAEGNGPRHRVVTTTAAFPAVNPPGWYANRYHYGWMYPYYAYYDYSHGPYANWPAGGGYAYYEGLGHNQPNPQYPGYIGGPHYSGSTGGGSGSGASSAPATGTLTATEAGTICITLPADATLKFNGVAATGTGATRTFRTQPLEAGREYAYELTAEVVRDGQAVRVTERVVVRAGRESKVTLAPAVGVAVK